MSVEVADNHYAHTPFKIRRSFHNDSFTLFVFLVESVHVTYRKRDPHTGLPKCAFAEKYAGVASLEKTKVRRTTVVPFLFESQFVHVIVDRRGKVLDVQKRDYVIKTNHVPLLSGRFGFEHKSQRVRRQFSLACGHHRITQSADAVDNNFHFVAGLEID